MANAKPQNEQTIRAEIKRYYYDVGDQGSAAQLNSALTVLLRPGLTREDRQRILDHLDVFTRVDPTEYAHNRDWTTDAAIAAGSIAPGETAAGEEATGETAAESAASSEEAAVEGNALDIRTFSGTLTLDPWKLRWHERGKYLEKLLGGTLGPTFPTIDKITEGIATSIKSMDLNAATYQNPRSLIAKLGGYINDLEEFDGVDRGDDLVWDSAIRGRVLSLAIPKGSMTAEQRIVIESVRDWARTLKNPVDIIITEF